ncbi:hypothetical protein [Paraconexibacter sp.]|uniref:hypothetical protein n=1 Tax=Paraconexibacter sp. TaxID=2949640 RepID=UPI003567591C
MSKLVVGAGLAALCLVIAPVASAAPPVNDNRASATTIGAGADVTGTTVEATRELNEPPNCPAKGGASVWYRYNAPREGSARILLETRGGLDATVAIYEVERSTISRISCADSRRGVVFVQGSLDEGTYLIRVTEREGSESGTFRLRFSGVLTEPRGTGRRLPSSGRLRGTLNPLTRPFLRVSRRLSAGRSYRVRVSVGSGGTCNATIRLDYPDDDSRFFDCRDYTVITPDPSYSGTHVLTLEAGTADIDDERYDVSITPVGADDLAPGRFIGGFGKARGSVSGRSPDAEDVFRFDVTRRAEITLRLASRGSMGMQLRTSGGRRVTSASVNGDTGQIRTRLRPGRFYVIVSAADTAGGRYTLSRLTRVITATHVTWEGSASRQKGPGSSSTVQVSTSSGASGRATVTVERFDPQFGWRFYLRRTIGVSGGRGSMSVATREIGQYRARAAFLGTRRFSPSTARRTARLSVVAPLRE